MPPSGGALPPPRAARAGARCARAEGHAPLRGGGMPPQRVKCPCGRSLTASLSITRRAASHGDVPASMACTEAAKASEGVVWFVFTIAPLLLTVLLLLIGKKMFTESMAATCAKSLGKCSG